MFLNDGRMLVSDGKLATKPIYPRPLSEEILLKGIPLVDEANITSGSTTFDGRYIWFTPKKGKLSRMDVESEEIETFTIKIGKIQELTTFAPERIAYDEKFIWLLGIDKSTGSNCIIKVNPGTLEMTRVPFVDGINGNTGIGAYATVFLGSMYDGENLWLLASYAAAPGAPSHMRLVKVMPKTDTMVAYSSIPIVVKNMIRTENHLWLFNDLAKSLVKVDLSDMSMSTISISNETIESASFAATSGVYDGQSIWIPLASGKEILQFKVATEEAIGHVYEGENLGDISGVTSNAHLTVLFDGKNIWIVPYISNRLLKLDPRTVKCRGYEFTDGLNMGNISQNKAKFVSSIFDGKNMWLFPGQGDRIIKVSSNGDLDRVAITEKYQSEGGVDLKPVYTNYVERYDNYERTAPEILNYVCIGYRLNGGSLVENQNISINVVKEGHVVVFIYKRKDEIEEAEDMKLYILMEEEEQINLTGYILPKAPNAPELVWFSDDPSIASVNQDGLVTANKIGLTRIHARSKDGSWTEFARVKVIGKGVTDLRVSILLRPAETCRLTTVFNNSLVSRPVTWSSSDNNIVTVSPTGKVTALSDGVVIITVKTVDGEFVDHIYVTVYSGKDYKFAE